RRRQVPNAGRHEDVQVLLPRKPKRRTGAGIGRPQLIHRWAADESESTTQKPAFTSRMSDGMQPEEMATPGAHVNVQASVPHLLPAAVVGFTREDIDQTPYPSLYAPPRHANPGLGGVIAEVDGDKIAIAVQGPTPRH